MSDSQRKRISANWQQVMDEVAEAARICGRASTEVKVIGVSKYVDAETTEMLVAAGCSELGENRPQALQQKAESDVLAGHQINWHMIGHVQRNKLRRMLLHDPLIHSVDSMRLLTAIDGRAKDSEKHVDVLLDVNISNDESKTGLPASELEGILTAKLSNTRIVGLMAMAGWGTDGATAQAQFAQVRELRDDLASKTGNPLTELSMGMSADFAEAIAEGATMVRIGSRLFQDS